MSDANPDLVETLEQVSVAAALGMHIPTFPGQTVYIAEVWEDRGAYTILHQAHTSYDAAVTAIANWILDHWTVVEQTPFDDDYEATLSPDEDWDDQKHAEHVNTRLEGMTPIQIVNAHFDSRFGDVGWAIHEERVQNTPTLNGWNTP